MYMLVEYIISRVYIYIFICCLINIHIWLYYFALERYIVYDFYTLLLIL